MANLLEVTEKNWDAEVMQSEVPVLVDFWATWCGPCQRLTPTVEAVAQELSGKMKVVKCSTEEAGAIASRYGVMSIPTLMVIKGGKVVDQFLAGGWPKQRIVEKVQPHL